MTSLLDRIRRLVCSRFVLAGLAIVALALALFLIRLAIVRSLWLDEAWVANSVLEPTLRGMFYYDGWLQTSPPLFLLLERMTIGLFGLSELAFRAVPFVMGMLALAGMAALARKLLAPVYALWAWTLFALSPVVILYASTLKQYSSELAAATAVLLATALYLEQPSRKRFAWLVAASVLGLTLGYPVVFTLPGIVIAVALRSFKRGAILALASGAMLALEQVLFIAPNSSPVLYEFWKAYDEVSDFHLLPGFDLIALLPLPYRILDFQAAAITLACVLALAGLALAYRKDRRRFEILAVCAGPCLLLTASRLLGLYPQSDRLSLFALPYALILLLGGLQLVVERFPNALRSLADIALIGAAVLTMLVGFRRTPLERLASPSEEVRGAMTFLRDNTQPGDLIWVHASVEEDFRLYTRILGWQTPPARFGSTGRPCCTRNQPAVQTASEAGARMELTRAVADAKPARVRLLYTTRPIHWTLVGADESAAMESVLSQKGCVEQPTPTFYHLGVRSFACGPN